MVDYRRMPIGEYKGWLLTEVPIRYLQQFHRRRDIDPYLRSAIGGVLQGDLGNGRGKCPGAMGHSMRGRKKGKRKRGGVCEDCGMVGMVKRVKGHMWCHGCYNRIRNAMQQ